MVVIFIIILVFSAVLHEFMHGAVANYLGDPTARYSGRLTLNPLRHLDPMGSVFLPLMLVLLRSPIFFAYAKPVPVNPNLFRGDRKLGMLLTGAAGPLTNLAVAIVFALGLKASLLAGQSPAAPLSAIFFLVILVNLFLMTFNLLPIPPLDGSKVLGYFFPGLLSPQFERMGFILLILLLFLPGGLIAGIFGSVTGMFFQVTGLTDSVDILSRAAEF